MFIKTRTLNKAKRRAWEEATGFDRYFAQERSFVLRFVALGSVVCVVWRDDVRRLVRNDRAVTEIRFQKMYGTSPRSLGGGYGSPYAALKSHIRQDWKPQCEAQAMLDEAPVGARVDGWLKTAVPSNNEHCPGLLHYWVNMTTGEARATHALPFFWRYVDYCTPNGIC